MQSMGYVATILFIAFNFKIYIVHIPKIFLLYFILGCCSISVRTRIYIRTLDSEGEKIVIFDINNRWYMKTLHLTMVH